MFRPHRLPYFFLVLALAGCGGGGSTPPLAPVQPLALTEPGGYSAIATVRDDGAAFGVEYVTDNPVRVVPSFWLRPNELNTVPILDQKARSETIVDISPNRNLVLGFTHDDDSSGGPQRGFVYDRKTGAFHVLHVSDSPTTRVFPVSFGSDDTVTGYFVTENSPIVPTSAFVYHLNTDQYSTSTVAFPERDPGFPELGTSRRADSYSINRKFAAGQMVVDGHVRFAVWSLTGRTYRLVGPLDVSGFAGGISDDGATAVFQESTEPGRHWIMTSEGQFHDLMEYVRSHGHGQQWGTIGRTSLSPSGRYLLVTGRNGNFYSTAVRIQLR